MSEITEEDVVIKHWDMSQRKKEGPAGKGTEHQPHHFNSPVIRVQMFNDDISVYSSSAISS
jgi:hypothetical protein